MIFHENRLLAGDSHEISYLIFSKIRKDVAKCVICCSRDWRLNGYISNKISEVTSNVYGLAYISTYIKGF